MSRKKRYRAKPCPPIAPTMARLTLAQIEAAKSPRGGWTRATLHGWGVAWPPANGWKDLLTGGEQPDPAAQVKMVTIFADAAFDHRDLTGGWGCWIKTHRPQPGVFVSGPLKECPTSVEAEMRALANALHIAVARGLVEDGGVVMLQSDCTPALSIIMGRVHGVTHSRGKFDNVPIIASRNPGPSVRASLAVKHLRSLIDTHGLKIVVRHVRGHQNTDDGRSAINRQVDGLARQAARDYRASLKEIA